MQTERRYRLKSRWQLALRYSGLPLPAKSLAWALATWMSSEGAGRPARLEDLAEAASVGRSTVAQELNRLEANGWIRRLRGGGRGRANRYDATIPAWADAIVESVLKGSRSRTVPASKPSSSAVEIGVNRPAHGQKGPRGGPLPLVVENYKRNDAGEDGAERSLPWGTYPEGKTWQESLTERELERKAAEAAAELAARVRIQIEDSRGEQEASA